MKNLKYYKNNCEENYLTTPISVLRYISELENAIKENKTVDRESNKLGCLALTALFGFVFLIIYLYFSK